MGLCGSALSSSSARPVVIEPREGVAYIAILYDGIRVGVFKTDWACSVGQLKSSLKALDGTLDFNTQHKLMIAGEELKDAQTLSQKIISLENNAFEIDICQIREGLNLKKTQTKCFTRRITQ